VSGDTAQSRDAAEKVLRYARTPLDKQAANLTLMRCHRADLNFEQEIKLGLALLGEFGVDFPEATPTVDQLVQAFESTRSCVSKDMSREDLLSLPPMTDSTIEFCMTVMVNLVSAGYELYRHPWCCFLIGRLLKMTIQYGYCKLTPLLAIFFAIDTLMNFPYYDEAHKLTQVALQMIEDNPSRHNCGVLMYASYILSTMEPISKSMYLALEGYKVGMKSGELDDAFKSYGIYCWSFFCSGLPFEPLIQDMENYVNQMIEYKQQSMIYQIPLWQTLLNLSGRSSGNNPTSLEKGEAIDKKYDLELTSESVGWATTTLYQMQLAFFFREMDEATECYEKLKDVHMGFAHGSLLYHVRIFFSCLICIDNYRRTEKRAFKVEAQKHLEQLRTVLDRGAINLPHKVQLLDAEFALLNRTTCSIASSDDGGGGGDEAVMAKYRKAIIAASKSGFLQDAAMANYLCGQFCLQNKSGLEWHAVDYISQAIKRFEDWGATAVADSLRKRHADLFEVVIGDEQQAVPRNSRASSGHRSRSHFRGSISEVHFSLDRARGLSTFAAEGNQKPRSHTSQEPQH
jgi:hypothetical protein